MRLLNMSVAKVLASFQKNLTDLEAIAEAKARESAKALEEIGVLTKKMTDAHQEREHALRVHGKIKELIG